jgi:hypothetical protein
MTQEPSFEKALVLVLCIALGIALMAWRIADGHLITRKEMEKGETVSSQTLEVLRQQAAKKREAQEEPTSPAPWCWREREGGFVVLDRDGQLVAVTDSEENARRIAGTPINEILAAMQEREFRARLNAESAVHAA